MGKHFVYNSLQLWIMMFVCSFWSHMSDDITKECVYFFGLQRRCKRITKNTLYMELQLTYNFHWLPINCEKQWDTMKALLIDTTGNYVHTYTHTQV
jgi:hypothetical protein